MFVYISVCIVYIYLLIEFIYLFIFICLYLSVYIYLFIYICLKPNLVWALLDGNFFYFIFFPGESCHDVTSREASLQLKLEQLERENEELRKRLSNSKLI